MSFEKIDRIVKNEMRIREEYLKQISYDHSLISNKFWRSLSTIEINLGRRQGHTTYIQHQACNDDIILVEGWYRPNLLKGLKNVTVPVLNIGNFSGARGLKIPDNSIIWIDCASLTSSERVDTFLSALQPNIKQWIIKLG